MGDGRLAKRGRKVKIRILGAFSAVVVFVIAAFLSTVYLTERRSREKDLSDSVRAVETLLRQKIAKDARLMQAVVLALFDNHEVEQAFAAQNRVDLVRAVGPLFERLRRSHGITHLYFTEPDLVNLLRLHDREHHGDTIDRYTTARARDTGESAHGLELGPMGTLTLRTVTPWRLDGTVIGYVELGEEIGQLLQEIHVSLGLDLFAFVDKRFLSRQAWEHGTRLLDRTGDWEEYGDLALVAQTADAPPPVLAAGQIERNGRNLFLAGLPLSDASGRLIGRLLVVRDVTAGYRAFLRSLVVATFISVVAGIFVFAFFARALARVENDYRHQGELERRLLRLSSHHKRLIQVEKLSAVGTMIGEIAHQLNNPLVGVVNMAQLAERSADDPVRVRELLAEIRRAGQDCRTFVRRMLDFTKVSRSDRRPTDLAFVIDEAVSLFRQSAGRRVAVAVILPDHRVTLSVDPILLRHALFNLLTNAGEAMAGQGAASVSLEPADGDDGRPGWVLAVEDEGPGLSPGVRERLFTPFFTTRSDGTGLGLPVVLHVALLHDGGVKAGNRDGGGARFAIWLPVTSLPGASLPETSPPDSDAEAGAGDGL